MSTVSEEFKHKVAPVNLCCCTSAHLKLYILYIKSFSTCILHPSVKLQCNPGCIITMTMQSSMWYKYYVLISKQITITINFK